MFRSFLFCFVNNPLPPKRIGIFLPAAQHRVMRLHVKDDADGDVVDAWIRNGTIVSTRVDRDSAIISKSSFVSGMAVVDVASRSVSR